MILHEDNADGKVGGVSVKAIGERGIGENESGLLTEVREVLRWSITYWWWSVNTKSTPFLKRLVRGAHILTWSLLKRQ